MIAVDANLLIYAYVKSLQQHRAAQEWLTETFSSSPRVFLPWSSILAFLRLTTKRKLFNEPYEPEEALSIVGSWLTRPNVSILYPGPRHWSILRHLILSADVRGDLVTDAHLAALAIEYDATLFTADRDFRRFQGLRMIDPLV